MNSKRIVFRIGIALAVLAVLAISSAVALPIPPEKEVIVWFEPDPSSGPYGEDMTVQMWMNTSIGLGGWADWIFFDSNCVNITSADFTGAAFPSETVWSCWSCPNPVHPDVDCHGFDRYVKVAGMDEELCEPNTGKLLMVTLTLQRVNEGACISQLYHNPDHTELFDCDGVYRPTEWVHGNFTCGGVQTYTKSLSAGWNLISLPLTPTDNSTDTVLSGVSQNAVKQYNAVTKQFEDAAAMDLGTGYFVHVMAASTWSYTGTPESSTSTELKSGLNMIGVPNCAINVGTAMGSTDYRYVARWNATAQKFEVYNPNAPPAFHHFTTMEAGEGYFVSAKTDDTLTVSCSG